MMTRKEIKELGKIIARLEAWQVRNKGQLQHGDSTDVLKAKSLLIVIFDKNDR